MPIFVVEVIHRAYVQADDWIMAKDLSELVADDDSYPEINVYKTEVNDLGWPHNSLIYTQDGSDVTVEEAFSAQATNESD